MHQFGFHYTEDICTQSLKVVGYEFTSKSNTQYDCSAAFTPTLSLEQIKVDWKRKINWKYYVPLKCRFSRTDLIFKSI